MAKSAHHPIFQTVYVLTGLSKFFQRKSVKLVAHGSPKIFDPSHIEIGDKAPIALEDLHKSIDKGRLRKIRKALYEAGFTVSASQTIPPKAKKRPRYIIRYNGRPHHYTHHDGGGTTQPMIAIDRKTGVELKLKYNSECGILSRISPEYHRKIEESIGSFES